MTKGKILLKSFKNHRSGPLKVYILGISKEQCLLKLMEPAVFAEGTITMARITGSKNMRKGIQQMTLPKP